MPTVAKVIDRAFAEYFAQEWIAAWNAHDLDRVLSHYSDDFEMSSPVIVRVAGEPTGRLRGKDRVGAYWAKALALNPALRFELVHTLAGVGSITLVYHSLRGPAAEVFHFDASGLVARAYAHYLPPAADALPA